MDGCTNEGAVVLESGNTGSVLGSLCGFHSQGHVIINCKALGSVTAKSTVAGIGGLIGNIGNAAHNTGNGCVVKCTITGGTAKTSGLIIGLFNGKLQSHQARYCRRSYQGIRNCQRHNRHCGQLQQLSKRINEIQGREPCADSGLRRIIFVLNIFIREWPNGHSLFFFAISIGYSVAYRAIIAGTLRQAQLPKPHEHKAL